MATPALSIVIPVYNGAATVRELVQALENLPVPGGHEIILVDDGSEDESLEVCRALLAAARVPITLVSLARNFGEHNAVMAGLRHAHGAHVVTMDDDLQNPPQEVLRLLEDAQRTGKDVVYTRFPSKEHAPWRNLGSRFANGCAGWLLDKPGGLYLSSFRCLNAFLVAQLLSCSGPFPYVDGLILQATRSIGELTVQHLPRAHGRSNYTLRRLVRLWMSMLMSSVRPLRAALWLGMALSAAGLVGTLWALGVALLGRALGAWAALAALMLLLSGAQLIVLGLIGESLGRLLLTASGKPQWVARQILRSEGADPPAAGSEPPLAVAAPADHSLARRDSR